MNVSKGAHRLKRFDVGLSWKLKVKKKFSTLKIGIETSFDFFKCFQRKAMHWRKRGSLWHVLFVGSWMAKGRQLWWSLCKRTRRRTRIDATPQSLSIALLHLQSSFPSGVDRSITWRNFHYLRSMLTKSIHDSWAKEFWEEPLSRVYSSIWRRSVKKGAVRNNLS